MSENTMLPVVADRNKHVLFQTERGGAVYRMKAAKYADLGSDDKRIADDDTEVVCGPVQVLHRTEQKSNGVTTYGLEIEFPSLDGSMIREVITRGELSTNSNTLINRLSNGELDFETFSLNGKTPLFRYLLGYPAQNLPTLQLFEQGGWTDETFSRFLFKNATIEAEGLPGSGRLEGAWGIDLNKRGTLAAWQSEVAARAQRSRALQFALCIPFASVLSPMLGTEVTVFHLYVKSGSGKTTAAIGAASIFGTGKPASWDPTKNALRITAINHNHVGLILDELGQSDRATLTAAPYMLGNGIDKLTGKRDRSLIAAKKFRLLALSTGEASYSQIRRRIIKDDPAPATGELARFISLYVGSEYGVLDSLPAGVTAGEFIDAFSDAAQTNTGYAGEAFIHAIIEDVQVYGAEAVRRRCRKMAEDFISHCPETARKYGRILKRFAVVAVAGELAIEYGFLGEAYRTGDIEETVRHFVRVWSESEETEDGRINRLVDLLTGFPASYPREVRIYELDLSRQTLAPDPSQSLLRVRGHTVRDGGRDKRLLLIVLKSEEWTDFLKEAGVLSNDDVEEELVRRAILLVPKRPEKGRGKYLWAVRRELRDMIGRRVMIFDVSDPDLREYAAKAVDIMTMRSRG